MHARSALRSALRSDVMAGMPEGVMAGVMRGALAGMLALGWAAAAPATAQATHPGLPACRLAGVATPALCGQVARPLDPARPQGVQITVHYAVLPALARRKAADPVFLLAGGPGQSAISLAGVFNGRFGRLGQRRDLVLVDLRGTGLSAPLRCDDDAAAARARPLAEWLDADARAQRLRACRLALQALPHGDLRHYSTDHAAADLDAVRQALGAAQINLLGLSYGTRVALAYQRLHPGAVRRMVLDGVAPPDLRLPEAAAQDLQAALDALFQACTADPACHRRHPDPAGRLQGLLAQVPLHLTVPHPLHGRPEPLTLDRDTLLGLLRAPLYQPAQAAALPALLDEAAAGRWAPLLALSSPLGAPVAVAVATGLHHAVVCSEDLAPERPDKPEAAAATAVAGPGAQPPPATVFGDTMRRQYQQACAGWPRATLAADFRRVPVSAAPVWLLSGGLDPVTPPRHADRAAQALGPLAWHTVVPGAGHGVSALGCIADAAVRFIASDTPPAGPPANADCARRVPRPPAWQPPGLVPPDRAPTSVAPPRQEPPR